VVPTSEQKVIGLHFFGPNAGEIMQGYAVALKAGASWEVFQDTIGIHPTTSEEFIYLTVAKSSGQSADKQLCCG
jgi:thioredoxin reductase (NADPH)